MFELSHSKITKAVILAGGLGTRLAEETNIRPKPMVEIGGKPIIWHIMKSYSYFGINDFIICLGYKGYLIKEYFLNYFVHTSDITIDLSKNEKVFHQKRAEPWKITLVETGDNTMTGGRLARIRSYVDDEHFCMTYGDGVSDINIKELIEFHIKHGKDATVSLIQPAGRFGSAEVEGDYVKSFHEKGDSQGGWINAGFFILSSRVLDLVDNDSTIWEKDPMETLAKSNNLAGFKHVGFWHAMDTLRDKQRLEELWSNGNTPWIRDS